MSKPATNEFFDINKLSQSWGIIVFPISISRISNSQNPESCLRYIRNFSPDKVQAPKIGANFVYGDYLYLYSDKKAAELKDKFMHLITAHKNALQGLIAKNHQDFQIQHGFSYETWNQMYLGINDFPDRLRNLQELYKEDELFQRFIKEDANHFDLTLDNNQVNFFLEEYLLQYLVLKKKITCCVLVYKS
jgi:hypothetical protein